MDESKLVEGTVIHGTLRPQDVAPAYLHALEHYAPYYVGTDWFTEIADEVQRIVDLDGEVENAHDIIARLEDEINSLLPDGYRFGPHEGDPTDIGLWAEATVDEDEFDLMSNEAYVADGGQACPRCRRTSSFAWQGAPQYVPGGVIIAQAYCGACDYSFVEHYELAGFSPVENE